MRRCLFTLAAAVLAAPAGRATEPTYCKDVAPILFKNCASCHRPGEVGPFPLLSYRDAAKRAKFLAEVVAERQMPPWKAVHGFGSFLDERRLADAEIDTIARWAKAGAPEGDPKDLPPAPKFTDGWQLGEPDLVVTIPRPFTVPADGPDITQVFVVPTGLTETRSVAAVEFRPGDRSVVHHVFVYVDETGSARKKQDREEAKCGGPGYRSFGGPGTVVTGLLELAGPAKTPRFRPEDATQPLSANADLVITVHYHPSGKEAHDQSRVGIHFAKKPATQRLLPLILGTREIDIPAGTKEHVIEQDLTLPAEAAVYSVSPHMHQLGREMKVWAERPDGKEVPLIWVKDWAFNWQDDYLFSQRPVLPAGTKLKLRAVYDNSADNPANPNHPPQRVRYGEQTTDEMCMCFTGMIATGRIGQARLNRLALSRAIFWHPPTGE
jgi:hypothetical protein